MFPAVGNRIYKFTGKVDTKPANGTVLGIQGYIGRQNGSRIEGEAGIYHREANFLVITVCINSDFSVFSGYA